jgi:hypothetical protein
MTRATLNFAVLVTLVAGSMATAQEFPGLGVGGLAAMNSQFDAQFDQWARRGSWQVARQLPNNVGSADIIRAMQPHTVGNTWGGYNANWYANQQRQSDAAERYSRGAIRGQATFYDYQGQGYWLPYNAGGYHYGPNGYIYRGHGNVDYGQNLYYSW